MTDSIFVCILFFVTMLYINRAKYLKYMDH